MTVNKTNLSKLIAFLENGEDIIIAKAGNPVAKLISYKPTHKREANRLKGKVKFFKDFDNSNEEITKLFEDSIDEFDRMLISQDIEGDMTLISVDRFITQYDIVKVLETKKVKK